MKIIQRDKNGTVTMYNHEVSRKVFAARRKDRRELGNIDQPNHELLGKHIRNKETGKEYFVERVKKQFDAGWYYVALINNFNNSHSVVYFQNDSSMCPIIDRMYKEFWERFEFLS